MTGEELVLLVHKTVGHFFPHLRQWLDALPDPRDPQRITYPASSLFWLGALMFLFHLPARRRLRYDLNSPQALPNLNRLAQTLLETLPHPDTLAYLMKKMSLHGLDWLRTEMARQLLRKRVLERFRLLKRFYLVAIDATGYLSFSQPHCDQCLKKTLSNGTTIYYHPVLEAKLVCSNGLVISLATEFIQNTPGQEKQDCELNAFYRLLPRLRKAFPQLSICLLLDGLYLNQQVISLAKHYHCAYIITFKEGSLPETYREFQALHSLVPTQTKEVIDGAIRRHYRWVNGLRHASETFNAFECVEDNREEKSTRFFWATNLHPDGSNIQQLSEQGGRLRWKIENEGFNTQKNGGYRLEHAYCEDWKGARNFYLLMQIAHLISQLIEKGSLLRAKAAQLFGSVSAFAARLLEAWRTAAVDALTIQRHLASRFQIRLDSS